MSYSWPNGTIILSADTVEKQRDLWLAARTRGVTATDSRVLAGHGYAGETVYQRWVEKVDPDSVRPHEQLPGADQDLRLTLGTDIEPIVQRYAEQHLQVGMRRVGLMQAKHWPILLASCDRLTDDEGIAEIKMTTAMYLRPKAGDDAGDPTGQRVNDAGHWLPWGWWDQVQHQLLVSGARHAYVAALVVDNYTRSMTYWRIVPDPAYQTLLEELAAEFWDDVVSDTPPPVDMKREDLVRRWPRGEGDRLLTPDETVAVRRLLADRATLKGQAASVKEDLDTVEDRLRVYVGSYTRLLSDEGKPLLSWSNRTRKSPNMDVIETVFPELAFIGSAVKTTSFRAFSGAEKQKGAS